MKTLADTLRTNLNGRNVAPLIRLLEIYDAEKDIAKCYSAFAYLSCAGAGGSRELAETMAQVIEGFYMATSIHDDVLDGRLFLCEDCFFPRAWHAFDAAIATGDHHCEIRTIHV